MIARMADVGGGLTVRPLGIDNTTKLRSGQTFRYLVTGGSGFYSGAIVGPDVGTAPQLKIEKPESGVFGRLFTVTAPKNGKWGNVTLIIQDANLADEMLISLEFDNGT